MTSYLHLSTTDVPRAATLPVMATDLELLGSKLRGAREARGLTRSALADLSGVNARTIKSVESAEAAARIDTIYRLSAALRVDIVIGSACPEDDQAAEPYRGTINPRQRFNHAEHGEIVVEAAMVAEWPLGLAARSYGFQSAYEAPDLDKLAWESAADFRANAKPVRGPVVVAVSDDDPNRDQNGRPLRMYDHHGTDAGEVPPDATWKPLATIDDASSEARQTNPSERNTPEMSAHHTQERRSSS